MKYIKLFTLLNIFFQSFVCNAQLDSEALNKSNFIGIFQGVWENKENDSSLKMIIYKINGKFVGNFCSVIRNGGKIDCAENENFINMHEYHLDKDTLTMEIKGNYDSDSIGYVKLMFNNSFLNWNLKDKKGNLFVPIKTILKKSANEIVVISSKAIIYKDPKFSMSKSYFIRGDVVSFDYKKSNQDWVNIFYGKNKNGWLKSTDVK